MIAFADETDGQQPCIPENERPARNLARNVETAVEDLEGYFNVLLGMVEDENLIENHRCQAIRRLLTLLKENNMLYRLWEGDDRLKCTRARQSSRTSSRSSSSSRARRRGLRAIPRGDILRTVTNQLDNSTLFGCAQRFLSMLHLDGYSTGIGQFMWKYLFPTSQRRTDVQLVKSRALEGLMAIANNGGAKDVARYFSCNICRHLKDENKTRPMIRELRKVLDIMSNSDEREAIIANITDCAFDEEILRRGVYEAERLSDMISKLSRGGELTRKDRTELNEKIGHKFNPVTDLNRLLNVLSSTDRNLTDIYKASLLRQIEDYLVRNQSRSRHLRSVLSKLRTRGDSVLSEDEMRELRGMISSRIYREIRAEVKMTPQILLDVVQLTTDYGGRRAVGPLFDYYKIAVQKHEDLLQLDNPATSDIDSTWISTRKIALDYIVRQSQNDPDPTTNLIPILKEVFRHEKKDIYDEDHNGEGPVMTAYNSLTSNQKKDIVDYLGVNFHRTWSRDLLDHEGWNDDLGYRRRFYQPDRVGTFLTLANSLGNDVTSRTRSLIRNLANGRYMIPAYSVRVDGVHAPRRRNVTRNIEDINSAISASRKKAIDALPNMFSSANSITKASVMAELMRVLSDTDKSYAERESAALAIIKMDRNKLTDVFTILSNQVRSSDVEEDAAKIIRSIVISPIIDRDYRGDSAFRNHVLTEYKKISQQLSEKLKQSSFSDEGKEAILECMKDFSDDSEISSQLANLVAEREVDFDLKTDIVEHFSRTSHSSSNYMRDFNITMGFLQNSDPNMQLMVLDNINEGYAGDLMIRVNELNSRISPMKASATNLLNNANSSTEVRKKSLAVLSRLANVLGQFIGSDEEKARIQTERENVINLITNATDDPNHEVREEALRILRYYPTEAVVESPGTTATGGQTPEI